MVLVVVAIPSVDHQHNLIFVSSSLRETLPIGSLELLLHYQIHQLLDLYYVEWETMGQENVAE